MSATPLLSIRGLSMTVRKMLNRHTPAVAAGVGVVVLGATLFAVIGRNKPVGPPIRAFFSDDDGKTTFVDFANRLPPFDHDGKQAVGAAVFTTDGGRTRFVGYLERYTPDALKRLQAVTPVSDPQGTFIQSTEVKRPGDSKWIGPKEYAARSHVMTITNPGGGTVDTVFP